MSTYVSYRDGGKTSEEGFYRPFRKLLSAVGVMSSTELLVTERGAGANKSVDIAAGDAFFTYGDYAYYGWNTATLNDSSTAITANTSGNDRIDAVVAYIDLTVIDDTDSNNPDALKFKVVAGTPAGSPAAPDDAAIQASVGALNPFIRLANVAADNGYTSIVNADITDMRTVSTVIAAPIEVPKKCRVYKSSNQSVPNSSTTAITFAAETVDNDTMHDTSSNTSRITIKTAGLYYIHGQISFASSSTGFRQLYLRKNGSDMYASATTRAVDGDRTTIHVSATLDLSVNDYLELAVNQNSGGALNIEGAASDPYYGSNFEAVRLGPSS